MQRGASIILFCIMCWTCIAQNSAERRVTYTRKEGLTNNNITALAKDLRGFLWLGTSEGLNRFDGAHFTTFFSDASPSTLSGNNIFDILPYQSDRLLIATDNGLSVLNTLTGEFENEKTAHSLLKKGSGIYVRNLFQDDSGRILINHSGEIDVFTNDLRFLYRLTDRTWAQSLKGIDIAFEHCFQDRHGRIWLPTDNLGLCIVDEKAQQVYNYIHNPFHFDISFSRPVRSFYYDQQHNELFISFPGTGLTKFDLRTGTTTTQLFGIARDNEARTINAIASKDGQLICGGGQSIYSVDPTTLKYSNLYPDSQTPGPASFINCFTILKDQQNIWIGSETKGLIQLPSPAAYVRQIPLPDEVRTFPNPCSAVFRAGNGLLYFAYDEYGLVAVDEHTGTSKRCAIVDDHKKSILIHTICADNAEPPKNGNHPQGATNLLVGTTSGFYSYNPTTNTSSRTTWLPSYTEKLNVSYTLRDRRNNIWVAFKYPNALGCYETATHQFHYYPEYVVDGTPVFDPKYPITRITEDEKGNIWMISFKTAGKLLRYEHSSHTWTNYPLTPKAGALFRGKELNCILASDSVIWTGNIYGMGLIRYDFKRDSIRHIGRKDGLLSDNILSIAKDRNNNLLLCTVAGINHFNPATGEIRTLIAEDGNIDWGMVFSQYYDTLNNRLIYGLTDRIITAESRLWEALAHDTINVYIDAVKVNNEKYTFNGTPIQLGNTQRNISIGFTSINYNRASAPTYAYKMNGVDKDFNIGAQATTVNYSNLAPGSYTFLVKAKSPIGGWGPVNDSLSITIHPAIWQTPLFWIVAALSVILTLTWLIRRRIANIRHSAGLKQQLTEMEMMALRAQMNPHFIFNCLSAIDNLMQTNQADKATAYLASFARLIRSVLENSKNNVVPFHKDIETLELYLRLEQFRASNKFSYQMEVDQELMNGDYKVPPLIVQPFVENAIQHGLLNKQQGERRLIITASLKTGFIQYTIIDNGIGMARAAQIKERNRPKQRSYGIQITKQRLHLHNRSNRTAHIIITDLPSADGESSGTRIDVRVRTD